MRRGTADINERIRTFADLRAEVGDGESNHTAGSHGHLLKGDVTIDLDPRDADHDVLRNHPDKLHRNRGAGIDLKSHSRNGKLDIFNSEANASSHFSDHAIFEEIETAGIDGDHQEAVTEIQFCIADFNAGDLGSLGEGEVSAKSLTGNLKLGTCGAHPEEWSGRQRDRHRFVTQFKDLIHRDRSLVNLQSKISAEADPGNIQGFASRNRSHQSAGRGATDRIVEALDEHHSPSITQRQERIIGRSKLEACTSDDHPGFGLTVNRALLEGHISRERLVRNHQFRSDGGNPEVRPGGKIKNEILSAQLDGFADRGSRGIHRDLKFIDIQAEGQ